MKPSIIKEDKIDLIALGKIIWAGRKIIYYSIGLCIVVGLLIALLSPPKYKAGATLLPSPDSKSSNMGGLSALAGMAGVNIGSMLGQSAGISADVYPQILNSYPLINELIHEAYNFRGLDKSISLYDFMEGDTVESALDKVSKYTIKLPWTIKDLLIGKTAVDKNESYGVIFLTEDELKAHKYIREVLNVSVDINTGLVSMTIEVEEPVLAAQLVNVAVELLQKYISEHKTDKLKLNLNFIQERYLERKLDFEKKQIEFLRYKDSHRGVVTERADFKFQQLKDEYELAELIYKELAQQFEQASIAVKEVSPAFTVIEPPKVPDEKSSHGKVYYLIVFTLLGVFIGICIIIGKSFMHLLIYKIKQHA